MSVTWKIRYHDGKTKTNEDGPLSIEEHFGVLVVSFIDKETVVGILQNEDYYVLHKNGNWTGHNFSGLLQSLVLNLDSIEGVCLGLYVDSVTHEAALSRAVSDPDFGRKTSWRSHESKGRDS